ncbi:hypothetical protein D3C76_1788300 [compost metagenome]
MSAFHTATTSMTGASRNGLKVVVARRMLHIERGTIAIPKPSPTRLTMVCCMLISSPMFGVTPCCRQ